MSGLPSSTTADPEADPQAGEHYLVSHGKSGGVGSFVSPQPLILRRGDRVVVDGPRGREVGTVLCPASIRQSRLLGAGSSGNIVRSLTAEDETALAGLGELGQQLFDFSRDTARRLGVAIEILDVDLMLDGRANVLFVGQAPLEGLAAALHGALGLEIRLENLAVPAESHGGCGKPDCGREAGGGGGCSSCSSGGCSTCGSGQVDLSQYFAHLRGRMETAGRVALN